MRCLWTVFLTLLVTSSVLATELTGPVVSILDGDTIEVLTCHHAKRIRLSSIDSPEKWIKTTISQFPRLAVCSLPF
jgi:endonuclease YncB( thermonuclease family)